MYEGKFNKFLTVLLVIVVLAIVGLLAFLGYDFYRKYVIEDNANDMLSEFDNQVSNKTNKVNNEENTSGEVVSPEIQQTNTATNTTGSSSDGKVYYKGFVMVGKIEIPKTNCTYPILESVTKDSIEVAVAVLYGPGINQPGNTVIAGHNYRNGTFFSNNKKLEEGDKIYVTDTAGNKVTYTIYKTYTTSPEDSDYFTRDTEGRREISLTTCTDDVKSRLIIWAKAD